jgi:hypothetical protein
VFFDERLNLVLVSVHKGPHRVAVFAGDLLDLLLLCLAQAQRLGRIGAEGFAHHPHKRRERE